jgi:hypothetical protein
MSMVRHRGFVHSADVTCPKCGVEEPLPPWSVPCTSCGQVLLGGDRMPDMASVVQGVTHIVLVCPCGNAQTWVSRSDRVSA